MRTWGLLLCLVMAACVAEERTSTISSAHGALCPNGTIDQGEECDDGNFDNTDACIVDSQSKIFCQDAECGDGFVHAGVEQCDEGFANSNQPDATCRPNCMPQRCGDGITDTGEQCDDGNQDNTDSCTNLCELATCGDGFVQGNEECDDGNQDNTDACITDSQQKLFCEDAECGDGFVQAGVEPCDDGNQSNNDGCLTTCVLPTCGDGFVQGNEECDDGNQVQTDFCLNNCMNARCGDGFASPIEECDDGNQSNADGCVNDGKAGCQLAECGDGFVHVGVEECDSGTFGTDGDCIIDESSANSCKNARCGDGYIRSGVEACDDGNTDTTDNCPACQFATCGDGFVLDKVEECDDGNQSNTDGCISVPQQKKFCELATCGDGFINLGVETCDDGNMTGNDGCSAVCRTEGCGDGMVNGNEMCDGGGQTAACDTDCTPAVCGDGVVNTAAGEACDEGSMNSDTGTCRTTCLRASCGDGVVDSGEECDDGILNGVDDFSGCSEACEGISASARSGACSDGTAAGMMSGLGLLAFAHAFRRRRRRLAAGLAAVSVLVLVPAAANAEGFRLGRFAPAPSLDDGLTISLPTTLDRMKYSAMLTFDYADRPFVLKTQMGNETLERDVIDDQFEAHANLALGLGSRFEVQLNLPVTLAQDSTSGTINMESFGADSTSLGDIRVGGAVRLVGDRGKIGPLLGLAATLVIPSGDSGDFTGDSGVGADLGVLAAYKLAAVTLAANVGVALRPSADFADMRMGSELAARAGAVLPVGDKLNVYAELAAGALLRSQVSDPPPPVESLAGMRYRFGDFVAGFGAGAGLTDALGVPVWRALVTFGTTNQPEQVEEALPPPPPPGPKDTDNDGILDTADRCVTEPEDKDGFEDDEGCPDLDNDQDQIVDASDKCTNDPEDKDGFEDEEGCPDLDNDADKIVDANDKCINEAETVNQFQDDDGCPDQIPRPTLEMILSQLAERIQFEYDSAELTPDSTRVLGEVATLLNQVPELELLSIEGHASKEGSARHNDKLSKDRAQKAYDTLVAGGVTAARLKASHFGTKKPIGDAKDESSRKASRRVEFHVLRYNGQDVNVQLKPGSVPPVPPAAPAPAPAPAP